MCRFRISLSCKYMIRRSLITDTKTYKRVPIATPTNVVSLAIVHIKLSETKSFTIKIKVAISLNDSTTRVTMIWFGSP